MLKATQSASLWFSSRQPQMSRRLPCRAGATHKRAHLAWTVMGPLKHNVRFTATHTL